MPLEVRGNGMLRWCWEKECPNKLLHISDRNIICIDSSPGLGTDFGSTENHFWKSVFVVVHFWFEPFYVSPSFWMPVPLLHFPPNTMSWLLIELCYSDRLQSLVDSKESCPNDVKQIYDASTNIIYIHLPSMSWWFYWNDSDVWSHASSKKGSQLVASRSF